MTLTIKKETKEERRARWRFLPARPSNSYNTNDPAHYTNAEMIAIMERHERGLLDAAKRLGLPIGEEYERE